MSPKSHLEEDFEGNHWQPANSRTFSIYEFQGQFRSTVFLTNVIYGANRLLLYTFYF